MSRLRRSAWLVVPIAAYFAITVLLPAANGAAHRAEFVKHVVLVVLGCAAVFVVACAIAWLGPKGDRP
ncbi:MAG TPA: hypothetical protein VGF94_23140 [Kofleriaceae bacterium]|jgi:hypothetical protein